MPRLPAEWEPQQAVVITWPHAQTDWQAILSESDAFYFSLVQTLINYVSVIVAAHPGRTEEVSRLLDTNINAREFSITVYPVASNDTWTRDHGPIGVLNSSSSKLELLDFTFNAWGNKFDSELDNVISRALHQQDAFGKLPLTAIDLVLEGGAIDSDGNGTLLTTEQCLLNPNRNPSLDREDIEGALAAHLGISKVLWLKHGYLSGDDTDSHVDTLARFAPNNTITYVSCDDQKDEHYSSLSAMEGELSSMTNAEGAPFDLIALPLPSAIVDDDNHRLPATYANYLISNGAVIVPTYNDPKDQLALSQIAKAFPQHQIVGLDCRTLIKQHGSLHCATMQIPSVD